MIKRILVALDPDRDTRVAVLFASDLALRFEAEVTGLAVVNTRRIAQEVGPGGAIGAGFYAEEVREHLTTETRSVARRLIETFENELEMAQVRHFGHIRDGVPDKRIIQEMLYYDILVIGRTPHFFYPRPDKKTPTLVQVVKNGIVPTLVVPDKERVVRRVLIAYDGSDPSARTMQRFAQLQPFGTSVSVELLHVRPWVSGHDENKSEFMLSKAAGYLKSHGFSSIQETSLEMDQADLRVLAYARESKADLIVAGAHSVSAVKRLAFGSTTHALLQHCDVPFFLHH